MSVISKVLLALTALSADALRLTPSTVLNRRAAVAGLVAAPAAAGAVNNPLDTKSFSGYKERNYGGEPAMNTQVTEKKVRRRPDGFGGYIEREEDVKPVINRILGDGGDSGAPTNVAAAPARKPSIGESTRSSSGSSKALSVDEMVQNSIASREQLLGRELTADEKKALADKVKSMLGA